MKHDSFKWAVRLTLSLMALVMAGCGCNSEPKSYNVTVSLSQALIAKPTAIEVHLIGVSEAENPMWSTYSMKEYWENPNNSLREGATKYVMKFGAGEKTSKTLLATDPIWEKWKGATRLYVLAYLPGKFNDAPEDRDPRRRILPLDKCSWAEKEKQEIKLTLLPSNVMVETPPLTPKK